MVVVSPLRIALAGALALSTPAGTGHAFDVVANYTQVGTPQANFTGLDLCDTLVSTPSGHLFTSESGLGHEGGLGDSVLDSGELMEFQTNGAPFLDAGYVPGFAFDVDGDADVGEAFLEGFGASGQSLGVVIGTYEPIDVAARFGGAALQGFALTAIDALSIASFSRTLRSDEFLEVDLLTFSPFAAAEIRHSDAGAAAALRADSTSRR